MLLFITFSICLLIISPNKVLLEIRNLNLETDQEAIQKLTDFPSEPIVLPDEDVEHILDNSAIKGLKDGPIQLEIVGDTTHLFADEDLEKKEVILVRDNQSSSVTNETKENVMGLAAQLVSETVKTAKICSRSNLTTYRDFNTVQLVNGSYLTQILAESSLNDCFLVLFYVPWCQFSTRLAPIYNALPKAFPNLDIIAFDVSKSIGYNTKFGTSTVPMIILFKHKSPLAKFNYTHKNLTEYIDFISNKTGFEANRSINISESDFEGPVPTIPVERFDYYLFISWLFVMFVSIDFMLRKSLFKLFLSSGLRRLVEYARHLRNRFSRRLAIDQQEPLPALMQATATSNLYNNNVAASNQNLSITDTSAELPNDYYYRPRRNLHEHED